MNYKDIEPGKILHWIQENFVGKLITESRSPAGNWMGFTLDHIIKGEATISLTVKKEMCNPYNNIHGGMMSLVIDETIGWAVVSLDSETHYTSMNLNVDFLYAIKEGERLISTSKIIRHGKKVVNAECHVYNAHNVLLAKASSNLITTSMPIKN